MQSVRVVNLTPQIHPVPSLRMSGFVPPFCVLHAVHSDKFTFFSRSITVQLLNFLDTRCQRKRDVAIRIYVILLSLVRTETLSSFF